MSDKKNPAVIITDVAYDAALERIKDLEDMNHKLESACIDRLVRAESAEQRAEQLQAERDELAAQVAKISIELGTALHERDTALKELRDLRLAIIEESMT